MALHLLKEYEDGFVATYHRVNDLSMRTDGKPCSFTLESYATVTDRGLPGAKFKTARFDFIPTGVGDPAAQAYAALMRDPLWAAAEPDSEYPIAPPAQAVPSGSARWEGGVWAPLVPPVSLQDLKAKAAARVDYLAGQARLRYITDVPGQAETYQAKATEAKEWSTLGFTGEPPPFIRAEASRRGVTPSALAQEILDLATLWSTEKGPEIEAARIYWKSTTRAAQTEAELDTTLASAEAELETL